jgi:hypothetical protein
MQNNKLHKDYDKEAIDLMELIIALAHSWKLIILITLAFLLSTFIYTEQKEPSYTSDFLIEIGTYESKNKKNLIEPVSSLIKALRIELIYKQRLSDNALKLSSIEDQILKISFTSSSILFNENLLEDILKFIQERHSKIIVELENTTSNEIKAIDDEINFLKDSLTALKKTEKNKITYRIRLIDDLISSIKIKINLLQKLIPEEESNLNLLKSNDDALLTRTSTSPTLQQLIYTYNEEIVTQKNRLATLISEKFKLEQQLNYISEDPKISSELFALLKTREYLEAELDVVRDKKNLTQPIHELATNEASNKNLQLLVLVSILGFIISVILIFIRQSLKLSSH